MFVYLAHLIGGARRRPVVVWHCHGVGDGVPPPFLVFLANKCIRVIAISKDTAHRLKEIGVDPVRLDGVIYYLHETGIDAHADEHAHPLLTKEPDHSVILLPCVAIRETKGVHIAIRAMAELPLTSHLRITGDPKDPASKTCRKELDDMIISDGLEGRVHFIGLRRDIHAVMTSADIVIMPSLCREGFSIVAVGAMALKKPVIVSDRGGLPEAVWSQENGWFFESGDPKALAACVRAIFADLESAKQRAGNGSLRVEHLFRLDRWADEVTSVLIRCLPISVELMDEVYLE